MIYNALANVIIFASELGAIGAVAYLGYREPIVFAGLTAVATLVYGVMLERQRLRHDAAFYFGGRSGRLPMVMFEVAGLVAAAFKALLALLIALLIFAGTDDQRKLVVAAVFALTLLVATRVLRWVSVVLHADATRWGFFRLALPLGLFHAQVMALLTAVGVLVQPNFAGTLANAVDLPARPGLDQSSELLFRLGQHYDWLIERMVALVVPDAFAPFVAALASTHALTGFVVAIYAMVIARMVYALEINS